MKQTITKSAIIISVITLIYGFTILSNEGKVHLKISKQVNGEKSVFEKTYESMDALKADEELKDFDILVNEWINDKREKMIIGESISESSAGAWIAEDVNKGDIKKHIIIKKKGNDREEVDSKIEKIIKIKTENGEKLYTVTSNGDEDHTMVWVDENGNKTEINEETFEDMSEDGKDSNIKKRIEVITPDNDSAKKTVKIINDENGNMFWIDEEGNETKLTDEKIEDFGETLRTSGENQRKIKVIVKESEGVEDKDIIIMNNENEKTAEVEVEIEKEIRDNGEEVIKDKKIWITKDGKKVQINDENAFHIKTEGNEMTVTVDGKELDPADFTGGELKVDKDIMMAGKSDGKGEVKQIMKVRVDEKNGDTYIEINIKKEQSKNVTISEIAKADNSLRDINFSIKNNLKPSELHYYPNPNDGRFNLKFNLDHSGEALVKVLDILGNEVYKETLLDFDGKYDNELDLSGREKGVYILQIQQGRKVLSRKILIE